MEHIWQSVVNFVLAPPSTLENIYLPPPEDDPYRISEVNAFESFLDLNARFLLPLSQANFRSLSFGFGALIISMIYSFIFDARNDREFMEKMDNPLKDRMEDIQHKVSVDFQQNDSVSTTNEELKQKHSKSKSITNKHFILAVEAYEDFMTWSNKRTKNEDKWVFDELLEMAVKKAKSNDELSNPADDLLKRSLEIAGYTFSSVFSFYTSMIALMFGF